VIQHALDDAIGTLAVLDDLLEIPVSISMVSSISARVPSSSIAMAGVALLQLV